MATLFFRMEKNMEILQLLLHFFTDYGYFAVFGILILCGLGLPVPEDISLVSGGIIAALNEGINVHVMFGVGMAGVLIGDLFIFVFGKYYGHTALNNKFIAKIITPRRFERVQDKFEKYGKWVIFTGRFMPGLRTPIYFTAGMTKRVSMPLFFFMDFFASIISVPLWVYLGYFGAHNIDLLLQWVKQGQLAIFTLIGIVLAGVIIKYKIIRKKEWSAPVEKNK